MSGITRAIGKARTKRAMAAYHAAERKRAQESLLEKLKNLPTVNGKPDLSSIADPAETAKQWAAEAKLGSEESLERMLDYLDKEKSA
jgi:hypothetical protein